MKNQVLRPAIKLQGKIEFNNVQFAYPTRPDVQVLKALNISIKPGEKVALVGPSGSGKSTIINLLLQFYQPSAGTIFVDDLRATDYNLDAYRSNLGVVPQEVILFGGTIRENIAYGKPGATAAEITDAAHKANAWEFIESFPDGLRYRSWRSWC
jgi:ATP-binding cassette subfamily B protein